MPFVKVALQGPFFDGLDYFYDHKETIIPFSRVLVPFGKRKLIGVALSVSDHCEYDQTKVKSIIKLIDKKPLFSRESIKLIKWMSEYYHVPIYQVLKIALPKLLLSDEKANVSKEVYYRLVNKSVPLSKRATKQRLLVELLAKEDQSQKELAVQGITKPTMQALLDLEVIESYTKDVTYHLTKEAQDEPKSLNVEQKLAVDRIQNEIGAFHCSLLYGVTGSGKTEVYLQSIAPLINQNKQVLVLVPEINLTPQTLARFNERFNVPVAAISSKVSDQMRLNYWFGVKEGTIKIVIATRAGLLYQFKDLAMIIVDEEHDASFKQQSGVYYHARDVAIMKAHQLNIPIILGSATPSIESYYHATVTKKYELIQLSKRALSDTDNDVNLIDLQKQKVTSGLSNTLKHKIDRCIKQNKQALIFVNRRGFAHTLVCNDCGWCAMCEACDKPYTLHMHPQHLSCHFCAKAQKIYHQCPNCHSDALIDIGHGTEKLEQYLAEAFPNARITRLDRTITQKKGVLEAQLDRIAKQKTDIIIGTQMIAKGHDFKHVALVGIVNADSGFYSQDFHSIERTAQLITQVAGRGGRAGEKGDISVQSYQVDNPMLNLILNGQYQKFLDSLLLTRQYLEYPPFFYQVYLYVQAQQKELVLSSASGMVSHIKQVIESNQLSVNIVGPISAIHERSAGKYLQSVMLTAESRQPLQQTLHAMRAFIYQQRKVKIIIDIDPIEMK
ncbi:replication restart helicase PriA [Fangia hongkongensis]|uniref:replication restart helicase PriA n=1 Tax=Fangia hongkongensis TaxID=270495 RepID=UPI00037157C4|nr:primosomal protein N' [Fangia hongkongensis]MBK2123772.1 primosomal protein N' [Fangia hongkongensis]